MLIKFRCRFIHSWCSKHIWVGQKKLKCMFMVLKGHTTMCIYAFFNDFLQWSSLEEKISGFRYADNPCGSIHSSFWPFLWDLFAMRNTKMITRLALWEQIELKSASFLWVAKSKASLLGNVCEKLECALKLKKTKHTVTWESIPPNIVMLPSAKRIPLPACFIVQTQTIDTPHTKRELHCVQIIFTTVYYIQLYREPLQKQ